MNNQSVRADIMTQIRTQDVTAAGIRTIVRTAGLNDGDTAIILLHGNPGSSEDWVKIMPNLAELGRVIAPDMPGYGKSERPKKFKATVPAYGHYLSELLATLNVKKAHLVLHDFGGPWGMDWACRNPDRLASLTFCNTGVLPGYRWHKSARLWGIPIVGELLMAFLNYKRFRSVMNQQNPTPFPEDFIKYTYENMDAGMIRLMLRLYRSVPDPSKASIRYGKQLAEIKNLPVAVFWGAEDRHLPVKYANIQKQFFPDAEIHEMEGCGHWPFIDEPEKFKTTLYEFLAKQLPLSDTKLA